MQDIRINLQRNFKLRHKTDISKKLEEAIRIIEESENYLDRLHEDALNSLNEEEYSGF